MMWTHPTRPGRTRRRARVALATLGVGAVMLAAGSGLATEGGGSAGPVAAPSGQAMPVGDIPGWDLVFADDFTTDVPVGSFPAAVQEKWGRTYPDGWPDTSGNGTYFPSKVVSIANGVMNLNLHTEDGKHLVAAPVPTVANAPGSRGGLMYGRYAIRFRADPVHGYKTAWLMWPDSRNWPYDGEINFPEGNLDGIIKGYLHPQGGTTPSASYTFWTTTTYESWHTAVLEWTPERIVYFLDGQIVGSVSERIPNTPLRLVLQTETSTNGDVPDGLASANVEIDWVTMYAQSDDPIVYPPEPPPITAADARLAAIAAAGTLIPSRIDRLRARGLAKFTIDAPGRGLVDARLTARIGGRNRLLGTGRLGLLAAGPRTVTVRLTPAARVLLRGRTAALRARLTVTYSTGPVTGTANRTVTFPGLR